MANKTCGECRYFKNGKCYVTNAPVDTNSTHPCWYFRFKPTNGDVIRQGGDDALMAFKKKHKCDCCIYIRNGNCTEPIDRKDRCADGLKHWRDALAESEVGR